MLDCILTSHAENDLKKIATYTLHRFGVSQASVYRDGLFETLSVLAEHPFLGSNHNHVKPGTRRFTYKKHVIYYRTTDNEIIIMRIFSTNQDPLSLHL